MQKTVSILIFENSFTFSCYKLSKFWNGSSDDFSEKGRENMRSSTAESTRVGCDVTWDQYQLMLLKEDTVHFLHARFIWGLMRMAAHYDQDQKEPYFNNEESPD